MAYSMDFIEKAVAFKQSGQTFAELKKVFGIPNQTYYLWAGRLGSGYYEAKRPKQERKRKIDREGLKQAVIEKPDAYLHELAGPFGCSPQSVCQMLKKLDITLKKRPLPILKNQRQNALNTGRA
jgi:transposase